MVKSQVLDVEHRVDFKVTGDVELIGIKTKPPQYHVRNAISYFVCMKVLILQLNDISKNIARYRYQSKTTLQIVETILV